MKGDKESPIQVAIYAPDGITHIGLSSLLRHNQRLTQISIDAAELADVVVVTLDTCDASTINLLERLSPKPTARFLLIVEKGWNADITAAVEHGVRAVLWRSQVSPDSFSRTLMTMGNGGGCFPPSLQSMLMKQVQHTCRQVLKPRGLTASGMTEREIDVLRLLAEGFDIETISLKLCYSERTVKNILHNVIKRLDLRNRTHAVSYAMRAGLF